MRAIYRRVRTQHRRQTASGHPTDLRGQLDTQEHGEAFYIAPGQSGVVALAGRTFEAMATEQSLVPDGEMLEYEQLLYSQAARVEMDKAGRVRIPERMLRIAAGDECRRLGSRITWKFGIRSVGKRWGTETRPAGRDASGSSSHAAASRCC